MDLKIKIENLPPGGRDLPLDIPEEAARERLSVLTDGPVEVSGPLRGDLRVEKAGAKIVVRGRLDVAVRLACARCLENFDHRSSEELLVVFAPAPTEDVREDELDVDALNQEMFTGDYIDLWPTVAEHVILGLPLKPLCRPDCRGLCPECGADRNAGDCGCQGSSGHAGLSALAAIREKLPK